MKRRDFIRLLLISPLGRLILSTALASGLATALIATPSAAKGGEVAMGRGEVVLPLPRLRGDMSVEEALARRRSVREYLDEPLRIEELAQILWAAYGISSLNGFRTAPSAGALYPLNVYVVVGNRGVLLDQGFLEAGVYRYVSPKHSIVLVKRGDIREELYRAALSQPWVLKAPISLVITAIYERTGDVYGERGVIRYVHMEAGHLSQNVYLQATALGLGTVAVGAFYDEAVATAIGAPPNETPLYIMPIGRVAALYNITEEELLSYYANERSK